MRIRNRLDSGLHKTISKGANHTAFKEVNQDLKHTKKTFYCDTEADVAKLPKSMTGSEAVVVSTGNVYVVNASGVWTLFGGDADA